MSVLDQVMDLKKKGVSETDITTQLREKGVSPKEINDALSQARIKNAVSAKDKPQTMGKMQPSVMRPERAEPLPTEGGLSDADLTPPEPSHNIPRAAQDRFAPMTKEISEEEYTPQPQSGQTQDYSQYQYSQQQPQLPELQPPQPSQAGGQTQDYSQYQYQYQPQEYYQQGYGYGGGYEGYGYTPSATGDTDTLIEISEQVFAEKIKTIQKQLSELNEFKTLTETKIENISDRLKRLESNIDKLQAAILEKVGSYGRGLDGVKKEMSMMQDSFGKMVGKLAEGIEKKHTHKTHKTTTITHKSGKKQKRKTRKKSSKKK